MHHTSNRPVRLGNILSNNNSGIAIFQNAVLGQKGVKWVIGCFANSQRRQLYHGKEWRVCFCVLKTTKKAASHLNLQLFIFTDRSGFERIIRQSLN